MNTLADIIRVAYLGRAVAALFDANAYAVLSGSGVGVGRTACEAIDALADVERAWGLSLNAYAIADGVRANLSY
jgi:hypothetical protein